MKFGNFFQFIPAFLGSFTTAFSIYLDIIVASFQPSKNQIFYVFSDFFRAYRTSPWRDIPRTLLEPPTPILEPPYGGRLAARLWGPLRSRFGEPFLFFAVLAPIPANAGVHLPLPPSGLAKSCFGWTRKSSPQLGPVRAALAGPKNHGGWPIRISRWLGQKPLAPGIPFTARVPKPFALAGAGPGRGTSA